MTIIQMNVADIYLIQLIINKHTKDKKYRYRL